MRVPPPSPSSARSPRGALPGTARDARTGGVLRALEGSGGGLEWLQWHPRGHVLLAGSEDFTAWLWNADDGACMQARVAPALSGSRDAPPVACLLTIHSPCTGVCRPQRRRLLRRIHARRPQRVHSLGGCEVSLRDCLPPPGRSDSPPSDVTACGCGTRGAASARCTSRRAPACAHNPLR